MSSTLFEKNTNIWNTPKKSGVKYNGVKPSELNNFIEMLVVKNNERGLKESKFNLIKTQDLYPVMSIRFK